MNISFKIGLGILLISAAIVGFFFLNQDETELNNHTKHQQHEMMVTSEKDFILGMIPHHQEAVDTAKEVIARGGKTPEIKQLAENIVIAQELEIVEMKRWYRDWYGEEYSETSYVSMMRDLGQLSDEALDRAFLEDMIIHHKGAIMMAQSVQPYVKHSEVKNLAEAIVTNQLEEIQVISKILLEL